MRGCRKCQVTGCPIRASFGVRGSRPMFCQSHKQADHVNLQSRPCSFSGCERPASYRKVSRERRYLAEFCSDHAPIGYVSHIWRFCSIAGCNYVARFRRDMTHRPTHCELHAPNWYLMTTYAQRETAKHYRSRKVSAPSSPLPPTPDFEMSDIEESSASDDESTHSYPLMKVEETDEIVGEVAQYLREIESESVTFASF